ncbi:glycosyltransferase [Prevotella sp. P6B1]|uniref:glycosyltransferase n=1 Tax=Prevotella sp. P6B1 TaxID=1410613 RepID=UPI00051B1171|nr:glycosyltransferase [Prevotella sp. P6B1]
MISVCIATYNGEKFIRQQLESILPQLSMNDEIVISDDHSTDNTIEIIKSLKDARIHLYFHEADIHAMFHIDRSTHNFVNALSHANGDIIFLADQDDFWLPNKVETTIQQLKSYDLVISNCIIGDEALNTTGKMYSDIRPFKTGVLNNIIKSHYLGCCMAFRKDVYQKALPFPKHGVAHDLWIGLTAERFFRVGYIKQPLVIYRRHTGTVTYSGKENKTSLAFKLKYRLLIVKALISHNNM